MLGNQAAKNCGPPRAEIAPVRARLVISSDAILNMQPEPSLDANPSLRAIRDDSAKEVQQFLEHVVHDLRSARRGVGISAEVLLSKLSPQPNDEFQQNIRYMQQGLAQMDAVLSGVSNYSLSLRASAYSFKLVSAEMAVRLAAAGLAKEVRAAGATVTYGPLPRIVADSDRLTSLFRNLIDNALKYRGAAAPQVEIQAKRGEGNWLFSVQDNGIGIEQKYWYGILEPFGRLHGPEIPGVGLGLAICKKILDAHGGTIWIESVVGSGTTFFFTLPAAADTADDDGP